MSEMERDGIRHVPFRFVIFCKKMIYFEPYSQ